jgi:hypothetical protein
MPETEVTRDRLFASVHNLQPGDILVIRVPDHTTPDQLQKLAQDLRLKLEPLGVESLLMSQSMTLDVVRHDVPTVADAVRQAQQFPGRVFTAGEVD